MGRTAGTRRDLRPWGAGPGRASLGGNQEPGLPKGCQHGRSATRYLGLELPSPLVASPSPLTGSLEGLKRLEAAGAGAVVLPSLFEEQLTATSWSWTGCWRRPPTTPARPGRTSPTSMVSRRINAVPVVDAGDLLRLIARSDHDIQADLERRIAEELQALQRVAIEVEDGVVTVEAAGDPCRQLVEGLARTIPGVVEVRSQLVSGDAAAGGPPPTS
jgi:hypothetical protein